MQKNAFDTSSELHICRFNNGIKLIRPDRKKNISQPTVGEAMQMPFPVYFGNLQQYAAACNDSTVEECGFTSMKECLSNEWFKPFKRNSVISSIANHNDVMINNRYRVCEELVTRNNDTSLNILSFRMPWYNDINEIIGLFGCSIILDKHSLSDSLSSIQELGVLSNSALGMVTPTTIQHMSLTNREIECLHLTIRGNSARKVATRLGISQRTVEEYLNNIKFKMGVKTKAEMIDAGINLLL